MTETSKKVKCETKMKQTCMAPPTALTSTLRDVCRKTDTPLYDESLSKNNKKNELVDSKMLLRLSLSPLLCCSPSTSSVTECKCDVTALHQEAAVGGKKKTAKRRTRGEFVKQSCVFQSRLASIRKTCNLIRGRS